MTTGVSVAPYLVEQWAVCDGNTQGSEASAEHHVVRSVIPVAAAAAGQEPGHRHSAEDHPARGREQKHKTPQCSHQTRNMCTECYRGRSENDKTGKGKCL